MVDFHSPSIRQDRLQHPRHRQHQRRIVATLIPLLLCAFAGPLDAAVARRTVTSVTPPAATVPSGNSLGSGGRSLGTPAAEPLLAAARGSEHSALSGIESPWLDRGRPNSNAYQLIDAIASVRLHGLNPDSYSLDTLRADLERFDGETAWQAQRDTREVLADWQALEQRLEDTFTRLATDLGRGVTDARAVQRDLFRDPPTPPTAAWLIALRSGQRHVQDILAEAMPSHRQYRQLMITMQRLLDEQDHGAPREPITHLGPLDAEAQGAVVRAVRHRLVQTGDLEASEGYYPWYDASLALALRQFQARHGLSPSSEIDAPTAALLNRSLDDDLRAVALSLERWRWMPRDPGDIHVFVNLPSYRLEMYNGQQRIVDMRVVIGSVDNPTPEFSQSMSYLELNPTWTVPTKIAVNELLPKEKRKPGYLKTNHFEVLEKKDGHWRVRDTALNAGELAQRPFPYLLRQTSGPHNALGRMKFMMPNPHAIYLHDTQAQHLFDHPARAYSHGCIRLSDPDRLASLVLQLDGKSAVEATMVLQRKQTTRVLLDSPIPVHLAYFTAEADSEGRLRVYDDVYRQDAALVKALSGADTLLSRLGNHTPG